MTSQRTKQKQRRRKTTALLLILSFLIAVIPTIPLTAEKADTDEITIVREETDRRTASEKHFLCSDGSMMAVSYSGDIHYMDETGKYQTIDNTLSYSAAKGQYRTVGNPNFTVSFGQSADQPGVIVMNKEGNALSAITTVLLNPQSAAARRALAAEPATLSLRNEAKVQVKGLSKDAPEVLSVPELHSELVYENAHGSGITSEYALDGNTLKENVIFDYPVSYTAIETQYTMEGLFVEVTESGALILYGADNEAVYVVEAPYMYDASGAECPAVSVSATRSGDTWTVRYVPDESWRTSSERVYPVVFDPLIQGQTNSNIEDMYSMSTNGNFNGTTNGSVLKSGIEYYSSTGKLYVYRTFIKPVAYPVVPEGNTIVHVSLTFKTFYESGSGNLILSPIGGNADFAGNDYTIGAWIGATSYNNASPREEYSFGLPITEYNNCGNGYVITNLSESPQVPENGGTSHHYVSFYSSDTATLNYRPKMAVTYVPVGISDKVTTLYHSETGKYLTASSDTLLEMTDAGTPKSLWEFRPAGYGTFRIVSRYQSGKCLHVTYDASSDGYTVGLQNISTGLNNAQTFYVQSVNGQYKITNELYGIVLYVTEDASGNAVFQNAPDADVPDGTDSWQMLDLAPGVDGVQTNLANPEAGGFLVPTSETTVGMVQGITEDVLWEFVQSTQQSFQIVSVDYPDKCLAAAADGNLSLVTKSSNTTATIQYWYLSVTGDGYILENVANHKKLSVSTQNGALTCTLSDTEQVWTFMDYDIPYEVFALKNTDLYLTDENATNSEDNRISLYLKNTTGWNYNTFSDVSWISDYEEITFSLGKDERIACMDYVAGLNPDTAKNMPEKSEAVGDYCGFRLKPESSNNAYRIMPLSSGNGHQRAMTVDIDDELNKGFNSLILHKCVDSYEDSQLFIFEMLSDGSFVVKLESMPSLVLTGSLEPNSEVGIVKMSARTGTLENQTWVIEEYMAYLPQNQSDGGYHAVPYTELETYYAGLNFGEPRNTSNLVIVSDYGPRDEISSPGHMGIDLRANEGTKLYAPYDGTVVEVGTGDKAGKYVKIKVQCDAFPESITGSKYELYIVYMHLSNNTIVGVGQSVSKGDEVGLSGSTGTQDAHLHYGVFLVESKDVTESVSYNPNQYPLNPLMFVNPDRFKSGEVWAGVECVYWD